MELWHLTLDAPREPRRVAPGERVALQIGTWPIEPGQSVWVTHRVENADGAGEEQRIDAAWQRNDGANSFWRAEIGPFALGDQVSYVIHGRAPTGEIALPTISFSVGPRLYLALLWHQHQPSYKDTSRPAQRGSYLYPWVRLHAIRDYYAMADLVADHPGLHLTINLTPTLLWQIEDYLERGATDQALELTLKPAETLTAAEREQILATFFDAHWHNQIFPHPRYKELFIQRREGRPFAIQDVRDLQMWFNLAWFGQEFRQGDVRLSTGEVASVRRFVEQGRDFTTADIAAMVAEQRTIMRAVVPIHRQLQDRGQIEVTTTPFAHPILPLLIDTDRATLDRPGASLPRRFAHPEDAEAQVRLAVACYERHFGRPPRGMWPAEGAVSQSAIPFFARHGVRWLATDRGVLARSGRWGYNVDDPDVLCQPYRAEEGEHAASIFFRDTALSDAIGFQYYSYAAANQAAHAFLGEIKGRFARRLAGDGDRVLTVVLDGENAWGAYPQDARPFLHALYGLLEHDIEIQTVTFAEYLDGNPARGVPPHPREAQARVYDLFTGSWIDEFASAPGVDLGTWIGEGEENQGWELLGQARDMLSRSGATLATAPAAYEALHMAEGSDWFWWFGADQDSGNDDEFDNLFRIHLRNVYRGLGVEPPPELERHIVSHAVLWTFTQQTTWVQAGDRLTVRTNCPGRLTWQIGDGEPQTAELLPAGGVMAGIQRYHLTLGTFPAEAGQVRFRFHCTQRGCDGRDICCKPDEYAVRIGVPDRT
jgi:alpha-amylase/alpha-mannosidase (GH57 family)